jgi:glutaredoxin 3
MAPRRWWARLETMAKRFRDAAAAREEPAGWKPVTEIDAPVVLYGTRWCGYCTAARRLLKQRGVEFVDIDVGGEMDARRWLEQATGRSTVPQIFIHGRSIGGYTELHELDASQELMPLVAGPP